MKRLAIALVLSVWLLPAGSASAAPAAPSVKSVLRTMGIAVPAPPEWDGVWEVADSIYTCLGVLTGTSPATKDTLCTGQSTYDPPPGMQVTFSCDGTATATEFHVTCSGSVEVVPDCQMTIDIRIDGTRTADTYFSVATVNTSYSGTGLGCDLIPSTCSQINSHGTRTGPAPVDYCATPARPSSWGEIKAHYR